MFRKTKYLFMLCIFLVTACVTGGLSIWVFTNSSATTSTTTASGNSGENTLNDGIKENYSFGQNEVGTEYVYFFFPSTLYMELYCNGYTNKPENVFGYNEVKLNDVGDPLYVDGKPQYKVSKGDSTNPILGIHSTYYDYMVKVLNKDSSYYRYGTYSDTDSSHDYSLDPYIINTPSAGLEKEVRENEILSPRKNEPTFGLNLDLPNNFKTSDYLAPNGKDKITISSSNLMEKRKYRNDRFGAWSSFYDLDDPKNNLENSNDSSTDGEGNRYLPIKLTVHGSLNPDIYQDVIPQLVCGTYDDHIWFDFTSNVWTYYRKGIDSSPEYTNALGGFTAKDVSKIFDIMQNPSLYATQEDIDNDGIVENVVRLYPIYSNGKDAGQQKENGGRDALRATFEYQSKEDDSVPSDDVLLPTTLKLTYSTEHSTTTYNNKTADLNYAVIKNLSIVSGKYSSITIFMSPTSNPAKWSGAWSECYTLSSTYLDYLIKVYGEGLYTFYLVIGNSTSFSQDNHTAIWGDNPNFLRNALTQDRNKFGSLYLKNLLFVNPNGKIDEQAENPNASLTTYSPKTCYQSDSENNWNVRPVCLLFEKVTSLRVVKDISFPKLTQVSSSTSGNETSSTTSNDFESHEFVWSDIDSTISDIYSSGDILVNSSDIYDITKEQFANGEDAFIPGNSADISDSNPYIYVIQNADFRNVDSLFFQIRFGSQYINNAMELNVGGTTEDYYAFKYGRINTTTESGATTSKNAYRFFESQSTMFNNNSSNYFIQTATVTDANGVKRTGLKLKDATAKGVYDLLLIRDLNYTSGDTSSDTSDSTNKYKFNMYIYRHKIDFVKVFNGDPGTYTDKDELEFIAHNLSDNPETKCIWENSFFLGDILSTGSVDSKTSGNETTLKNAILSVCNTDNKVYGLYDAVTGDAIAYIKNGVIYGLNGNTSSNKDIDLFTLAKNYVLYIGEVKSTSTSS